ncbi:MAG: hypothetical protein N0E51_09725 [Candidatus Thiodiazotropha weberae]|nr:hypothetical protein [Candidatus Thiodiazotropha weberae]
MMMTIMAPIPQPIVMTLVTTRGGIRVMIPGETQEVIQEETQEVIQEETLEVTQFRVTWYCRPLTILM